MSRGIDWVAWPPSSHRPPLASGPSECKRQRYGEGAGAHDHQREPGGERGFSPENSRLGESENSDDDTADDQPGQEEEEEEEDDDEDDLQCACLRYLGHDEHNNDADMDQ